MISEVRWRKGEGSASSLASAMARPCSSSFNRTAAPKMKLVSTFIESAELRCSSRLLQTIGSKGFLFSEAVYMSSEGRYLEAVRKES